MERRHRGNGNMIEWKKVFCCRKKDKNIKALLCTGCNKRSVRPVWACNSKTYGQNSLNFCMKQAKEWNNIA